jgi:hypothetical protein
MKEYYYKLIIGDWSANFLDPESVVSAVKKHYKIEKEMDPTIKEFQQENHWGIEDWHKNLLKHGPDWEVLCTDYEVKAIKFEGWKVKLTYFKDSGKYYSCGEYTSKEWDLHQVFKEVGNLSRYRKLPDLISGHSDFLVLISVPEHPHDHPHMIVPSWENKYNK